MRRYPELIAQIKMFVNEANRDKAGVVGIENGSKNYLLEAIIEVVFQHFNLVSHVVLQRRKKLKLDVKCYWSSI